MQPEFRDRPAFQVMGVQVRANPTTADYGDLWGRQFASRVAELRPFAVDDAGYGVYFCTGQEGEMEILAGMAVQNVPEVPAGLVLREVPAAREAVFTTTMAQLGPTWGRIYGSGAPEYGVTMPRATTSASHPDATRARYRSPSACRSAEESSGATLRFLVGPAP